MGDTAGDGDDGNRVVDRAAEHDLAVDDELLETVVKFYFSSRRRVTLRVLYALVEDADTLPVTISHDDLSRLVAAAENDCNPTELSRMTLDSARTGLHQNHLPVLDSYDIIQWDKRSRMIRTSSYLEAFVVLLDALAAVVDDHEDDLPDITERRGRRW